MGWWKNTLAAMGFARIVPQAQKRSAPFAGAGISRLTASLAQSSASINADLDSSLEIMRSRARGLCANSEWGRRFLSLLAANIVGAEGPVLQVRARTQSGELDKAANDAIEIAWARWSEKCDITGRQNLAGLLRMIVKTVGRDGEALVRKVRRRDLPFGYALQVLEADRLDHTLNQKLSNGNVVRMGVEATSEGRPVALYIRAAHPGDNRITAQTKVERVDIQDVCHLFVMERPEQVRGYTWLHAVLIVSGHLHGYKDSAVIAARVGASKMGVFTRTEESAPGGLEQMADEQSGGQLHMSSEPGEFFELPPGYNLESWNPEYPHQNFEAFVKACMRGIASGLDVATHNLSGDMTDVNYSSARIAELSEREMWKILQGWLISSFLKPVYAEWLEMALIRGDIRFQQSGKALPAETFGKFYDASHFQARTWSWVDPMKEVQASRELIAAGLASRTQIAAGLGREWDDIVAELTTEKQAMQAAGLVTENNPAPPTDPDEE